MDKELTRASVDPRYTWDVTRVYADDKAWEKAFDAVKAGAQEFSDRAGTLSSGRDAVLDALQAYMALYEEMSAVYCYAMMKLHEDTTVGQYQAMNSRAATLSSDVGAKTAFLTPELLTLEEGTLESLIDDPAFADYDAFLRGVLRMKAHTLSQREEQLLAMAAEIAGVPESAYDMLSDADLDLGKTRGEDGKKTTLTDARLSTFLESPDRAVRKAAYCNVMNGYAKLGNTIAALYAGQVKAGLFEGAARGYGSPREMALYPDEVDEAVYDSLIDAVHGGLDTLAEYLRIRRDELGLAKMHMYDLYAKTGDGFDVRMDIDEAFATFLEAVAPLGEDYVKDASRALEERWIDVYETKNKRGGAYCSGGVYKTAPYVLLNHKNTYDGLSTLCHEMGHAMHSFYSNRTQPFAKADYTIFVAEVASTCNEILLSEYLLKKYEGDHKARLALIGSLLEHFRTTVFRQTMFAEFEHKAHAMAQEGQSLTKESLCGMYYDLNKLYYGRACVVDREVANEWMRIPHFYSPFYVYKYATGFCAAVALARNVLSGDAQKVAAYRKFLTLGGSMPPIEELKIAGVDMSTPQPVCEALDYFAELVMEYRQLLRAQEEAK
ncbi:MAG: oligoendopeptidase F [Clostridia bacterium]|nr:oligoendopeptidase F [Clostridia bacterium]